MSAIFIFEPKNEIVLDANKKACELYGFEKEEFIGMSLQRISKDISKGRKEINNTFNKLHNHRFETVHYNKFREEIHIQVNASVIKFADRDAILSINNDISNIKLLGKQLDEYKQICKNMIEIDDCPALMVNKDLDIIQVNTKLTELLDYQEDIIIDDLGLEDLIKLNSSKLKKMLFTNDSVSDINAVAERSDRSKFNVVFSSRKIKLDSKELCYIKIVKND
jgi:PAS domain S-box-containing protein